MGRRNKMNIKLTPPPAPGKLLSKQPLCLRNQKSDNISLDDLNTLVIDMSQEKENRFQINGEPIDMSRMESIDIHIESGTAVIKTIENRVMNFRYKVCEV